MRTRGVVAVHARKFGGRQACRRPRTSPAWERAGRAGVRPAPPRSTVSDKRLTSSLCRLHHRRDRSPRTRALGMPEQPAPNGLRIRRSPAGRPERRRRLEDQPLTRRPDDRARDGARSRRRTTSRGGRTGERPSASIPARDYFAELVERLRRSRRRRSSRIPGSSKAMRRKLRVSRFGAGGRVQAELRRAARPAAPPRPPPCTAAHGRRRLRDLRRTATAAGDVIAG